MKLNGPTKEIIAGGVAHSLQSGSDEAFVGCYSRPSTLLGKYLTNNNQKLRLFVTNGRMN